MDNPTSRRAFLSAGLLIALVCVRLRAEEARAHPGVRIVGTVTVDGVTPAYSQEIPNVVMLVQVGRELGEVRSNIVEENGKIEFVAMRPGTYYLYYLGTAAPPAETPKLDRLKKLGVKIVVGMADKDIGAVKLKTVPTVRLTGKVTVDGAPPQFDKNVPRHIALVSASNGVRTFVILEEGGKFVVPGLPAGKYLMYWIERTGVAGIRKVGVQIEVKEEHEGGTQDLGKLAFKTVSVTIEEDGK